MMKKKKDPKQAPSQSFRAIVTRQFRKNRLAMFSLRVIGLLVFVAIFADFIANEKPLIAKYKNEWHFPVFHSYGVSLGMAEWPKEFQNVTWKDLEFEFALFPPVPYLPQNIDYLNAQSVGPFGNQEVKSLQWRHWLGTDELGRDVLAGMIHGTRIATTVGLVSMSIASLIGIVLGSLAGFFGDHRMRLSRATMLLLFPGLLLAFFYAFQVRASLLSHALGESVLKFSFHLLLSMLIFAGILWLIPVLAKPLKLIPALRKKVPVPMDMIISRSIETMLSIPTLFLIISVIAIAKPSLFNVMIVIGLTSWTGIARFIRAELLRIRNLEYVEAAYAMGFHELRVLMRHAIPNALSPVLITVAFGIASAILIESTLSFLGLGVPPETLTWGSLLSSARQSPASWWLAVFPGLAIFVTVTFYNLVGEGLTDAMDPRLKK